MQGCITKTLVVATLVCVGWEELCTGALSDISQPVEPFFPNSDQNYCGNIGRCSLGGTRETQRTWNFSLISKYLQSQTLVNIKSVDVEVLAPIVKISPFLYTSLFLETFSAGRTLGFMPLSFQASSHFISQPTSLPEWGTTPGNVTSLSGFSACMQIDSKLSTSQAHFSGPFFQS